MKTKALAFILFVLFSQSGCYNVRHPCKFKVTPDYIKSNCGLYNGLSIDKLKNISYIEEGYPKEYEIEFEISYGASGKYFSKAHKEKMNKIFFNVEREGYAWIFHGRGLVTPTIPFDFEPNNWYRFGGLYEHGISSVLLYVYVNEDKSFQVYRRNMTSHL